jgi:hypothetical protein
MFAAPSCTTCVIAAASLHVSKKSCHSAKQPLLLKRKAFSADQKNRPGLRPGRFFYGRENLEVRHK